MSPEAEYYQDQGRQGDVDGLIFIVGRHRSRGRSVEVFLAAPPLPVERRVAVEHLFPETALGYAQTIVVLRYRGEVTGADHDILYTFTPPVKAEYALPGVGAVDPGKTRGIEVDLVEDRFLPQKGIEIANPALESGMKMILENGPLQLQFMVPFRPLAQFVPHEEKLLAGVGVHVAIEHAQVGELLPFVAGHLVDHGAPYITSS